MTTTTATATVTITTPTGLILAIDLGAVRVRGVRPGSMASRFPDSLTPNISPVNAKVRQADCSRLPSRGRDHQTGRVGDGFCIGTGTTGVHDAITVGVGSVNAPGRRLEVGRRLPLLVREGLV